MLCNPSSSAGSGTVSVFARLFRCFGVFVNFYMFCNRTRDPPTTVPKQHISELHTSSHGQFIFVVKSTCINSF